MKKIFKMSLREPATAGTKQSHYKVKTQIASSWNLSRFAGLAMTFILFCPNICHAAELINIRHSVEDGNVKIVFDFMGPIDFTAQNIENEMVLTIQNSLSVQNNSYYQILNGLLGRIFIKNSNGNLNIYIPLNQIAKSNAFKLADPDRLVVDIKRKGQAPNSAITTSFDKLEPLVSGIYYKNIEEYTKNGTIKAHALIVNPKLAEIKPAISIPYLKQNNFYIPILSQIFDFFIGGTNDRDNNAHFKKNRVSYFVKREGAFAGINGSFFFKSGTPVGTLIINKQMVSSPLYNRTALILFENGEAKIERVKMEGYLKLQNGNTFPFSAVNQPITNNEIMLYTPDYQMTDNTAATNIVIMNGKVSSVSHGQNKIPPNGFILCASGNSGELLQSIFKTGESVKIFYIASPILDGVKHIIAGGPRLVYDGSIYITGDEEHFRNDVKNSRAARTAVGITKEGQLIFLVVEKNNNGESIGATLTDLAKLMIKLGSYNAMNLDGGASSTMAINGKAVNTSDERPVCNAIVIKSN